MPYVNLNKNDNKNKKNKSGKSYKKSLLIMTTLILSFFILQIGRQIYLFVSLEEEYKQIKSEQLHLKEEFEEKNEILTKLEERLEKRGVGVTDDTFYQLDIHNIPQTK